MTYARGRPPRHHPSSFRPAGNTRRPRRRGLGRACSVARCVALACTALALLAPSAVQRLAAQETGDAQGARHNDAAGWARAMLDVDLRLADMADRSGFVGGVRALVEVRPGFRLGVGGHQMLRRIGDAPERTGLGRTLSFGYAGAVAELDVHDMLPIAPPLPIILRLLGGMGVTTLRDQAIGTRIGSERSGILEPELVTEFVRIGALTLGAGVGYRWAFAAEGPGSITAEDIRTPAISAYLRIGPF